MKSRRRNHGNNGKEKSNDGTQQEEVFQIRYLDLQRMIDVNDLKRFQTFAEKADLNAIQTGNKPFMFHAIEKNELNLARFLLDQEIDLFVKYPVDIKMNADSNEEEETVTVGEEVNALEYAEMLERDRIREELEMKLQQESLNERWLKAVGTLNTDVIDNFTKKFKNQNQMSTMLKIGLIKTCEMGSTRLIDYFIGDKRLDLNYTMIYKGRLTSPLLTTIEHQRIEAAKYLIFRRADINLVGEYGNALVTAIHYECPNELITLLLEKGASLASRHKEWPSINLREYCIQLNKVKSKAAIDEFVFKLIANGEYDKLKNLADNGYLTINVMNRFRKTGRDLAVERYHSNIVQLIDKIEYKQKRLKTKMNY